MSTKTSDIIRKLAPTSTSPTGARNSGTTAESFSFAKSAIDRQIIPLTNSSLERLLSPAPKGFQLRCENCTIRGNVDIISGVFNVKDKGLKTLDVMDDLADSYVQLVTDDIFAHIELETLWQGLVVNAPLSSIELLFLYIPVAGIRIPGVADIGVNFNARLVFEVSAAQDLQFKYGFEMSVPNNSTVVANLGNITQSFTTGFDDTEFTTLPFDFRSDNLNLTLSVSLRLYFEVSIHIGGGSLAAGVMTGISVDMPKYSMGFSLLRGPIDENCTEVVNRQPTEAEIRLGDAGLITNIDPSYEIGAMFELTAPTACLAHVSKSGLVEVTALAASISSDLALAASISSELARASSISLALAAASKTRNGEVETTQAFYRFL
ncbi:hypothetical protein TWF696_003643 [Orbilia brochopaga]|uniref:DUF7223 domain-containing protein n=1 Tax=Orbilia brochopaga TaxID=3140254 RepID=A0AAV9V6R9_9PEZI